MIIETKRSRKTYKDPIILWEYQTNRKKGIIEKTHIYCYERAKSYLIAKQKCKGYFSYKVKSILKKEETGIVLHTDLPNKSYLYLLTDDDKKAGELFLEHFDSMKKAESKMLELATRKYNNEIAKLELLSLMEIREVKQ